VDLLDDTLPALLDLEASAAAAAESGGGTAAAAAVAAAPAAATAGAEGSSTGGGNGGGVGGGVGGGSGGVVGGAEGAPPPLSEQEWLHALTALDPRPCAERPAAIDPSIRAAACARFAAMPRGLQADPNPNPNP
jgi:hypothetical protein